MLANADGTPCRRDHRHREPSAVRNGIIRSANAIQDSVVVIGSQPQSDAYSSVTINNTAGTRAAVEHLYSLGHRRIAVIEGPKAMTDSVPRWNGIRDYARQKGIPIDRSLVVEIQGTNSSYEEGYSLTQKLMQTGKPFSALIAFDDLTAFAAIGALSSAGRRVPEDCSVVGFDDIPGAAFYNPPLTTICQHLDEQGMLSAEIMQKQLSAKSVRNRNKTQKQIEPHLLFARVPRAFRKTSGRSQP